MKKTIKKQTAVAAESKPEKVVGLDLGDRYSHYCMLTNTGRDDRLLRTVGKRAGRTSQPGFLTSHFADVAAQRSIVLTVRRSLVDTLDDALDSVLKHALSRRSFLASAGGAAAASLVAGCSTDQPAPSTAAYTDSDILNFALNLEYLEAEFYLRAATGSGLNAADTAAGSSSPYQTVGAVTTSGNISVQQVPGLTSAQQNILNEIAYEEQEHVRFLRAALGANAAPRPALDLTYFSTLAVAANITTSATGSAAFTPYADFNHFLVGAFLFEDVGVTAYAGAAPLISTAGVVAGYLNAAAGILAVEAYHAATIRSTLTALGIAAGSAAAYPYIGYANQIAELRATLTVGNSAAPSTTGSVETPLTLPASAITTPSSPGASAVVAADPTNAIGFSRTVNQVHHIVYGSPTVGVKSGGFFPNGTNSIFATTTA
jgi:hypothetical protein